MKARVFLLLVLGVIAMCLTQSADAQPTQSPPGQIKAVRVVGEVTVIRAKDKASVVLKDNDAVTQGDVVVTAKEASVVLVFSNGSTVSLAENSRLGVDEFLQDPFGQAVKVSELKEEPSTSHTKLNLTYGELVGNVKHLKGASTYEVQTPVGAAGIRGTTFRLVYRPSGTGQAFFTLSTAAGEVIFQGTTGTPVPVAASKEVVVEVQVDQATGAVQSVQVKSQNISSEAAQIIQQQVTQAVQSTQTTTFTTTPSSSDNSQNNSNQQNQDQNQKQDQNQNQNQNQNQPLPQQQLPHTTAGDGQS